MNEEAFYMANILKDMFPRYKEKTHTALYNEVVYLYEKFQNSSFNDTSKPHHDCIVAFLKHREAEIGKVDDFINFFADNEEQKKLMREALEDWIEETEL